MKTRKLLALALALVMTFSLAAMALATDITTAAGLSTGQNTQSTGETKVMTIKVSVPGSQTFVINPYELTAKLSINNEDQFSSEQIFCAPEAVVSKSDVRIQVSAKVTGAPSNLSLKDTPEEADPRLQDGYEFDTYDVDTATADLFAYMAFVDVTSDDDGVVQPYPEEWPDYEASEDNHSNTVLVKNGVGDTYIVGELSAMSCAENEETATVINEGNALAFKVCGCANPFAKTWTGGTSGSKLVITTLFTFKAMGN